MAAGNALTASPATLAEVFSNGKRYIVPPFQRDYAWGEPEWAELWEDIIAASSPATESSHFLGALVLQPTSERDTFNIIDGQQRLVTLSVMVLAAISLIEGLDVDEREKQNNDERARLLRERFVSTKDSSSLQHRSRMKLNQTDDGFYQTYILQGKVPKNHRSGTGSEKRLQDCFDFFASKIRAHLGDAVDGAAIARFLDDRVANRLRFIEIRVEDDETAFTVFETLNARGVALGTADLLKNYIYACASKGGASDLEIARQHWARILRFIELEKVATLLFHKLAGSVQDLREKRVFVELKRIVPQKATVSTFSPVSSQRPRCTRRSMIPRPICGAPRCPEPASRSECFVRSGSINISPWPSRRSRGFANGPRSSSASCATWSSSRCARPWPRSTPAIWLVPITRRPSASNEATSRARKASRVPWRP